MTASKSQLDFVAKMQRERNEAQTEVRRLTKELEEIHRARVSVERAAYRRGVEAMRNAAAHLVDDLLSHTLTDAADRIRGLPVPQNEP